MGSAEREWRFLMMASRESAGLSGSMLWAGGWSLPPGVTTDDIDRAIQEEEGYDEESQEEEEDELEQARRLA